MIVIDANVIAYLLIKGDYTVKARKLLKKDVEWVAPQLWRSEFRNVLTTYVRNEYFNLSQAFFLMKKAEELMKGGEYIVYSKDVIELSTESGCSAYDCEYVALAKDLSVNLYTTDRKLVKSFPDIVHNLDDIIL